MRCQHQSWAGRRADEHERCTRIDLCRMTKSRFPALHRLSGVPCRAEGDPPSSVRPSHGRTPPAIRADLPDLALPALESLGAGVHGVVAEHEIVTMRDGRADDEARVDRGDELYGRVRRLAGSELSCRN